ncbi:MAG: 5-formyltetrahydrofolate cyclo-ligase [Candidatus Latescibacteria bacterium]|jgi:5-formyltetrahydrofolate cyclo-ligase|nr:5-formyltetrahydrofolate cyclo-ligase [Candidatus Latescibacterota bacterium]
MQNEKAEIRRSMIRKREALAPHEAARRGEAIRQQILEAPFYQESRCLSCYVSVSNEVDTHELIRGAIAEGKRVAVPVARRGRPMTQVRISDLAELVPAPFGLLEPAEESWDPVPPDAFDLVIVPGLAFDHHGNRIGFGGGFYDRFLAGLRAAKVGIAYGFQQGETLPTESHDVKLDWLVTESRILQFHGP